jgi:hypothetical protein
MFSNLFREILRQATPCSNLTGRRRSRLTVAVVIFVLVQSASAQRQSATVSNASVKLRIQLSWWPASSTGGPLRTTATLQPLDSNVAARTLEVKEGTATVIELPRGRYQITTTSAVTINGQAYGWSIELPLVEPTNEVQLSQENAVRLSRAEIANAGDLTVLPGTAVDSFTGYDTSDAGSREQISALLSKWTSSLRHGDLKMQMTCYTPKLATYKGQHNVSREQVRQEKERLLVRYPSNRRVSLSNVQIKTGVSQADATALKTWDFTGTETQWRGQAIIYFVFQKIGGRWMISSEWEHLTAQGQPMTAGSATSHNLSSF